MQNKLNMESDKKSYKIYFKQEFILNRDINSISIIYNPVLKVTYVKIVLKAIDFKTMLVYN